MCFLMVLLRDLENDFFAIDDGNGCNVEDITRLGRLYAKVAVLRMVLFLGIDARECFDACDKACRCALREHHRRAERTRDTQSDEDCRFRRFDMNVGCAFLQRMLKKHIQYSDRRDFFRLE